MSTIVKLVSAVALSIVSGAAWAGECAPSAWGADDEIGMANQMTPESVLGALQLAKKGEVHPLGIVIDPQTIPAYAPRSMALQVVQPGQPFGKTLEHAFGWDVTYNDDMAQLWFGVGPQLDGLGHAGVAGEYYNCNRAEDFAQLTGLTKLGIEKVPPMVARGVLLDMTKYFNVDVMEARQPITSDDIRGAAEQQGVEIRKGDVVLFHTGWTDAYLQADPGLWSSTEPGLSNEASEYLASLSPMAVGADNWAVEAVPANEGDREMYGHTVFLKENGIYLLEVMNTGRLARENVNEFLFVLGQARVKGAVQMIVNPVAMW